MPDDETNDPLLAALRGLPREVTPPRDLEGATVAGLRRAGLMKGRTTWRPWLMAAGLVIAAFGAGFFAARRGAEAPPSPTYALMLYGGSTEGDSAEHDVRAAEYGAWAGKRHPDGEVVGGEALGVVTAITGRATALEADKPVGFFLVRAPSPEAATRLAQECPHIKYGGRIVVRAILPT